jgi:hypothetical protein
MKTLKTVFFLSFFLLPLLYTGQLKAAHAFSQEKISLSALPDHQYNAAASSYFDDLNDIDITDDDDSDESLVRDILFIVTVFSLFILVRTLNPERIPGHFASIPLRAQPSFLQVFRI